MGKEIPSESRAPITADFSKVRDGGVTKVQQPPKENNTMSSEDQVRLSRLLAGRLNSPPKEGPKPEVIDLDNGSDDTDEQDEDEGAEDEEDEGAEDEEDEDEDGNEDEDEDEDEYEHEEEADAEWEEAWEEDGDNVTLVQLPQPKTPASSLNIQIVFIVTSLHEHRKPFEVQVHKVHGVYNHILDANKAAQVQSQGQGFMQHGERYKEIVFSDGTLHARAKGGQDERFSVDVEMKQYTVRNEAAV